MFLLPKLGLQTQKLCQEQREQHHYPCEQGQYHLLLAVQWLTVR